MRLYRFRSCCNEDCEWHNDGASITFEGPGVTMVPVDDIFKSSVEEFLRLVNEEHQAVCRNCKSTATETWRFRYGVPNVIFYCIQQVEHDVTKTTESRLPLHQNIQGVPYTVFAYSLIDDVEGNMIPHITTVFCQEGKRTLYDGLLGSLRTYSKQKL
jgi:hypothetical protein